MTDSSKSKRLIVAWTSPLAGAFLVAVFLACRALTMPDQVGVFSAFLVWFIERATVGYVLALPLMGMAYRLGLRHVIAFMLLASLAAFPLEHYISTPTNAWRPTEEELDHGFYWDTFLTSVLLASATGAVFSFGVLRTKNA